MGKSFLGPYRIVDIADVKFGADGQIYTTCRDSNGDVVGIILSPGIAYTLAQQINQLIASPSDLSIDGSAAPMPPTRFWERLQRRLLPLSKAA